MVKATLRSAVLLWVAAMSLLVAGTPGFAEVQNVRVGGDITVRGIHQENMDLHAETGGGTDAELNDSDDYLMTTTGVNIGADLTENVSAFIRLANERNWGNEPTGSDSASTAKGDFDISQAYITLKEFFYSPLTLRIGTQPIQWGRGLVLGSNLLPSVVSTTGAGGDRNSSISAEQFTDFTAFDAIRATLDLSGVTGSVPVTADYVYIKLDENRIGEDDDVNVQGINFSTRFDEMSSELEAYYLNKRDKSRTNAQNRGSVSTMGIRGSTQPVQGSYIYGELALQYGKRGTVLDGGYSGAGNNISGTGAQGWLANFGAEYTLADIATTPKLGWEWIYYSGSDTDGAFQGWDPVAPSYFGSLIRAFQIRDGLTGLYPLAQTGVTSGFTNQHQFGLYGGLKPIEDLSVDSKLSWFVLGVGAVQPTSPGGDGDRNRFLGTEWDSSVTYNYTDDVQLGLSYGLFMPGNVFRDAGNADGAGNSAPLAGRNTAQQLMTTVSVKF
jgi:hypothetical protein